MRLQTTCMSQLPIAISLPWLQIEPEHVCGSYSVNIEQRRWNKCKHIWGSLPCRMKQQGLRCGHSREKRVHYHDHIVYEIPAIKYEMQADLLFQKFTLSIEADRMLSGWWPVTGDCHSTEYTQSSCPMRTDSTEI